jgi:hypothetical protein
MNKILRELAPFSGVADISRSAVLDDGRHVSVSGDAAILRLAGAPRMFRKCGGLSDERYLTLLYLKPSIEF